LFEAPLGGNPLECQHKIWPQKTRILGLPDGEEIMTLAFCFDTIPARDRQMDRHVTIAITHASIASRWYKEKKRKPLFKIV